MCDTFHLVQLSEVTGSGCRPEEVWLKSTPGLWRAGSSSGATGLKRGVKQRATPSVPPAGKSRQCIWRKTRTRWRSRRGMLLFSSVPWRSGAKKAGSSSIHTGSRSTRSPGRQWDRPGGGRRFEQKVNVTLRYKEDCFDFSAESWCLNKCDHSHMMTAFTSKIGATSQAAL